MNKPKTKRALVIFKPVRLALTVSVCCFFLTLVSCKNLFSGAATPNSDSALYYTAEQQLNNLDYTDAITTIGQMSASGKASSNTQSLLASAYAGSCGLNFLTFAESLSSLGSDTLFESLLAQFKAGTTANVTACKKAESILLGLGTLSSDQNFLLALTEFVKIGRILSVDADPAGAGVPVAGFNACSSTPLTDSDTADIGVGMTIALGAINASGSTAVSGVTSTFTQLCSTIDSVIALTTPGFTGFCNITSASGFNSNELLILRSVIQSTEIGLATCGQTGLQNCICP